MGHQYRHRHGLKDPAGRAAQHDFPQPRMTIATHYDQISLHIDSMGQSVLATLPRSVTRLVI